VSVHIIVIHNARRHCYCDVNRRRRCDVIMAADCLLSATSLAVMHAAKVLSMVIALGWKKNYLVFFVST